MLLVQDNTIQTTDSHQERLDLASVLKSVRLGVLQNLLHLSRDQGNILVEIIL